MTRVTHMQYIDTIFEPSPRSPSFMRSVSSEELIGFRLSSNKAPLPESPKSVLGNEGEYKYPPLPPSPVSPESFSPVPASDSPPNMVSRMLISSDEIKDDIIWRKKILNRYKTSVEIRRANDVRDAFALGNYMPVSITSIIRRVQRIKDAEHKIPMKVVVECWVLQHLEIMVRVGMLRYI